MTTPSVRRLIASEYAWIGTAFIVLVAVAYLVLNSTTTGTFDKLERQNIAGQGARIASSLGYERSLISNLTSTNSEWDSLYDAVRLRQADGVGSLLPAGQMSGNFGLSAMVTLDRTGHVVSGGPIAAGIARQEGIQLFDRVEIVLVRLQARMVHFGFQKEISRRALARNLALAPD